MNREDCIRAIYEAERSKNNAESFRLFGMGVVSGRVYQQIKREAQTQQEKHREEKSKG